MLRDWIPTEARRLLDAAVGVTGRSRIVPANSWENAVASSPGYGVIDASGPPTTLSTPAEVPARGQQIATAFGSVLDGCPTQEDVRVLDVGGARGDYASLMAMIFPRRSFHWTILETPETVQRQRRFETPSLSWVDALDQVDQHVDIALASAVIQFVEDPHELVRSLLALSRWLVLNRVPLWPIAQDAPAVHRATVGGPALYPTWVLARDRFLQTLGETGEVTLRWEVPQDTAYFAGTRCTYQGFLVRGRSGGEHDR